MGWTVNAGCAGRNEWVYERHLVLPGAQWTWLLHQAASLELAGALGSFCHSSHCSSAPHQIPHLPLRQDWRTLKCVVSASFAHPTATSASCWGHLFALWVISLCQERIIMCLLSKVSTYNLSSQLAFCKAFQWIWWIWLVYPQIHLKLSVLPHLTTASSYFCHHIKNRLCP